MILWIILSLLTGGTVLLLQGRKVSSIDIQTNDDNSAEVNVYVDQLKQIESDLAQGTLSEGEASAARAEVARRLLGKAHTQSSPTMQSPRAVQGQSYSLLIVLLSIPILSLGFYAVLGSPELPSIPHATREFPTASETQIDALIQKVEARLKEAPDDGTGWDVIAPIYLRLGNYDKAHVAYKNAMRLLGENPKRLAGLIQSDILLKDGKVSSEARSWCERLLQIEPNRVDALVWLSLAKEQSGQLEEALKDYQGLLQNQKTTNELSTLLNERIEAIKNSKKADTPPSDAASPSSPDTAAAQQEMIKNMVDRLAKRLDADGKDAEGWTKLMRSYMVLGRHEEAFKSLNKARRALADDPQGLSLVNKEASNLGLDLPNTDQEGQTNP